MVGITGKVIWGSNPQSSWKECPRDIDLKGRVALDKWKDTCFSKMLHQDVTVKIKEVAAGFHIIVSIFSSVSQGNQVCERLGWWRRVRRAVGCWGLLRGDEKWQTGLTVWWHSVPRSEGVLQPVLDSSHVSPRGKYKPKEQWQSRVEFSNFVQSALALAQTPWHLTSRFCWVFFQVFFPKLLGTSDQTSLNTRSVHWTPTDPPWPNLFSVSPLWGEQRPDRQPVSTGVWGGSGFQRTLTIQPLGSERGREGKRKTKTGSALPAGGEQSLSLLPPIQPFHLGLFPLRKSQLLQNYGYLAPLWRKPCDQLLVQTSSEWGCSSMAN